MASIDNLKSRIHHKVLAGRYKLPCYINDKNITEQNAIILFYTNDNDFVSTSKAPYYRTGVQVCIRHNDYNTARNAAHSVLEYINADRKTIAGVYWIPETTPIYLGLDEQTGGYIFGFDVNMKGAK